MKAAVLLCVVAVASAAPYGNGFFPGFGSSATGGANANTAFGNSPGGLISSTSAQAFGSAQNGGSSLNSASAFQNSGQGFGGTFNNAGTNAASNQFSQPQFGFGGFGPNVYG